MYHLTLDQAAMIFFLKVNGQSHGSGLCTNSFPDDKTPMSMNKLFLN